MSQVDGCVRGRRATEQALQIESRVGVAGGEVGDELGLLRSEDLDLIDGAQEDRLSASDELGHTSDVDRLAARCLGLHRADHPLLISNLNSGTRGEGQLFNCHASVSGSRQPSTSAVT